MDWVGYMWVDNKLGILYCVYIGDYEIRVRLWKLL